MSRKVGSERATKWHTPFVPKNVKETGTDMTHQPYNIRKQGRLNSTARTKRFWTVHIPIWFFFLNSHTYLICTYICKAGPFWRNQCHVRNQFADLDRSSAPIFGKGCPSQFASGIRHQASPSSQIYRSLLLGREPGPHLHAANFTEHLHKDMLKLTTRKVS